MAEDHCKNSFNHSGTLKSQHISYDLFHGFGCALEHFRRCNWTEVRKTGKSFSLGTVIQAPAVA